MNGGCKLRVGWHVFAECIWALRHHYDAPRQEIVASLSTMIASESVVCEGKAVLLDALERYVSTKLDIVDCMLAAESGSGGGVLATFDQEIGKKFTEIAGWEWKV
ncbi:MAG: PIN domain-containing protein [Planctomycetota bacterium]